MKKVIYIFLLLVFIFSLVGSVEAYSTSKYSIDIPSTYSKVSEGAFVKENGDNINIQISSYSGGAPSYNNDTLNEFEGILKKYISSEKDSIVQALRKKSEEYGLSLTESQINEYANSFKLNKMEKKELVTCSKNKYDAYHFIASYSFGEYSSYVEQYYIVTKTDLYVISIGSCDKSSFSSTETTNMINSFKISNYEKPSSFFSEKLLSKMIAAGIVALFCGGIKVFSDKNKKNNLEPEKDIQKENEQNDLDKLEERKLNVLIENMEDDKKIDINNNNENKNIVKDTINSEKNKRYCTKCGKEIQKDWDFCNHCGNKLK